MKTFKLISLQVIDDIGLINIDLEDGLVINKEDIDRTWMLEAYVKKSYSHYFESLMEQGNEISFQIVISREENDPAFFQTHSLIINPLSDDFISLLFKGTVNRTSNYPELLLSNLLEKGLTGADLLKEFKEKMITRPALTSKKEPI